ncbi:MAG: hypothetical protein KAI66_08150 [Lentisphaeria bacterium]|nr:hypothetical protein [Lentisphaeria bacterium]
MKKEAFELRPRIGVGALSSPLEVGADQAARVCDDLAALLRGNGCEALDLGVVDTPERAVAVGRKLAEAHVDAMCFAVPCWFEDYLVLDLLEECGVPILLRPLPGMETGALCGTQQLTCYLKQLDVPFQSTFGDLGDADCLRSSLVFLRGAALKSRLRRARIGLAGNRINGMTHTSPNEFMLKKAIGPRVVMLDLPSLLQRATEMPETEAREHWDAMCGRAAACEVSDADGVDSMRVYGAIRELVETHGLQALTIGCYPHLMGRVCLAASLLADEGIPMACEGDVHGAIGQYLLQLLTAGPTHNTDWLDPVDDESVVFTHCGSGSFSLAANPQEIRLGSVRLMGQGACALFTGRTGPVTLININACPDGYQCAVLEGEAIPTDMVFPGNPTRVRFDQPVSDLIEWIHEEGLGHHWMIGYGHVADEIRAWTRMAGQNLNLLKNGR